MTTNHNNHIFLSMTPADRIQLIKVAASHSNPSISGLSSRTHELLKTKGFNIGLKTIVAALRI